MINRLIEPTSGRIRIDDEDVTDMDAVKLRRQIGYAIQSSGLFPHMTVAQNVAQVPKMAGWPKARIRARVEEMLDLVGLDPAEFPGRYPRQLSGGQQQRVGVARALAADPPVLLMDEPFGAVDPITRDHLQDELIRLQHELRKTIVFVTHDFDEAIKLGDRIAVLREQSHIAQFDTPEAILTNPADDFVSGFVGAGAALKRLNLTRVRDVEIVAFPTATVEEPWRRSRRCSARARRTRCCCWTASSVRTNGCGAAISPMRRARWPARGLSCTTPSPATPPCATRWRRCSPTVRDVSR